MQFVKTGWTYKFAFRKGFESLNGVYTVVKIYTYEELLSENIQLSSSLYALVGKTETEYERDYVTYEFRTHDIYKLVDSSNTHRFIYIPEGLLGEIPNSNVKKYPKIVLMLNMGIFNDTTKIEYVADLIKDQISYEFGITNAPDVVAIQEVWLTDEEYQDIENDRITEARDVVSYFTENIELRNKISDLSSRLNVLEKKILSVSVTDGTDPNPQP